MGNPAMTYADKSASALRHAIIEGELDQSQFSILAQCRMSSTLPEFRISAHIIGASHLLTIEIDQRMFHELFACQTGHSRLNEIASYGPLGRVAANIRLQLWHRVIYTFSAQQFPYAEGEEWLAELEQRANKVNQRNDHDAIGLSYDFPAGGMAQKGAKTIVIGEHNETGDQVNFVTAHAYPNDLCIVKSESSLQWL